MTKNKTKIQATSDDVESVEVEKASEEDIGQDNFFGDDSLGKGGRPPNLPSGVSRSTQSRMEYYAGLASKNLGFDDVLWETYQLAAMNVKDYAKKNKISNEQAVSIKERARQDILKRTYPELNRIQVEADGAISFIMGGNLPPDKRDIGTGSVQSSEPPLSYTPADEDDKDG